MNIRVRYFAILRELTRCSEETLELAPGSSVMDTWQRLCERHEGLRRFSGSVSFAVNQEYVSRDHTLNGGEELALIPPVSGG